MTEEVDSSSDRFVDTDADIQIDPATLPENVQLMATIDEQIAAGDAAREVRKRLEPAFSAFLEIYAKFGGHRYYGWNDYDDPRNYKGPMFWSEHDCAFRFALELEQVFPQQVHLELPVVRWSFADFKPGTTHQYIDIVVSDLAAFQEDDISQARFMSHRHEAFVEVKYFPAGCSRRWKFDHVRKVPDVLRDAERLSKHYQARHCKLALVLVVDDDGLFEQHRTDHFWPEDVEILVASPQELKRRAGTS